MSTQDILEKSILFNSGGKKRNKLLESLSEPHDFLQSLFIYLDIYLWTKNIQGIKKILSISESFIKIYPKNQYKFFYYIKKARALDSMGEALKAGTVYAKLLDESSGSGEKLFFAEALMKNGSFLEKLAHLPKIPAKLKKMLSFDEPLPKALNYFKEALDIYSELERGYNQAASVFNVSYLCHSLGLTDESYENCLLAIELGEKLCSNSILANASLQLANIYDYRKEYLMSKIFYEKALGFFRKSGNITKVSDIMHKLAWMFAFEKNNKKAEQIYEDALRLKVSIDYKQALGEFYFQRAMIMLGVGDEKRALKFFDRALFVYDFLGSADKAQFIRFQLFNIYKKQEHSLTEFMSGYKPPVSKEILGASINPSYSLRFGESYSVRPYNLPRNFFNVERKSLGNMLGEMSRLFGKSGNRNKYISYSAQYYAVKASLMQTI